MAQRFIITEVNDVYIVWESNEDPDLYTAAVAKFTTKAMCMAFVGWLNNPEAPLPVELKDTTRTFASTEFKF